MFAIFGYDSFGLFAREVAYALHGAEVKLDPMTLVLAVDEAVGMASETVHVTYAVGYSAIAHKDHHLMERLGIEGQEVPTGLVIAHVILGVALLGMYEVGEFDRIAYKEYRCVVTYQIPVAFVGIELERESAYVTFGIGRTAFTCHCRETAQHRCLLADLGEYRGFGITGYIVRDGKSAESTYPFGMYYPLGNTLAIEMSELLHVPYVLHQRRTALTGRSDILIVGDERTGCGSNRFLFHNRYLLH